MATSVDPKTIYAVIIHYFHGNVVYLDSTAIEDWLSIRFEMLSS